MTALVGSQIIKTDGMSGRYVRDFMHRWNRVKERRYQKHDVNEYCTRGSYESRTQISFRKHTVVVAAMLCRNE